MDYSKRKGHQYDFQLQRTSEESHEGQKEMTIFNMNYFD